MNLLDSLLDAIVRLEGDALVMHVGEKPYIVTATSAMSEYRGPLLWGHVDLSSRVLTSEAVLGLLGQILPVDQRQALQEFGAVEHRIESPERNARFSIIAARAGDEVWVEVRRRPVEVPAAVQQPLVGNQEAPPESVIEPQLAAAEASMQPPTATLVEQPIEASIDEPVEEPGDPVDTAEAVAQPAVIESPVAVPSDDIARPVSVDEATAAMRVERDETPEAPFEIVHEVSQDAPTDADVDALLAESAARLLRSAAPMLEREPLDIGEGAWLQGEEPPPGEVFEPTSESIYAIGIEPAMVAEAARPAVFEPMRLASEVESIAIAPELRPVALAARFEHLPLIAEIEPSTTLGPDPEPVVFVEDFDLPEPEPVPVSAEEEYDPAAFAEELGPEEDFRFGADPTKPVPERLAVVPELELLLVGVSAGFAPVAFAEDFRLVAPGADAFGAPPLLIEPEPEPVPMMAEGQPELFPFAEVVCPEDFPLPATTPGSGKAEATDCVPKPVATAPEPEPVLVPAGSVWWEPGALVEAIPFAPEPATAALQPEPAEIFTGSDPQPVYIEPEPVAAALQPVMASAPTSAPEVPAGRVIVPPAPRPPAASPQGEAGAAKAGSVHQALTPPTTTDPAPEFSVGELLRVAAARGASTVYLVARSRPMVRAEGDINVLDIGASTPLEESDIARLILDLAPEPARDAWQRGTSADWICDIADVGRVRCMTFRDHRGPGVIFRMIPPQAISADQLGLTPEVQALCTQSDGLVLVTSPRASGKSTLMSGFVDLINRTRRDHVITIESQIEFVHESRRSFVSQREVTEEEAVVEAVRSAMREDPDVLFIGDLSSARVAAVALEAAESGRLVFASLAAASTVAAVDRLLELLPDDGSHARASIAQSLRGVVTEVLVGRTRGGRVAAREVLLNTAAVAGLIQEGRTDQLPLAMESGRRHGMMPLNDVLAALVREGTVHVTEAYRKAFDKQSLLAALRQEGVDTSFAEKLA